MKEEFLSKTEDNLKIAQIGFEHKCYNACANRAYFAAFQGAIAALIDKGIKQGKFDHKWVQAEFNERLIKRQKVYPGRLRAYLLKMQLLRNMADYEHKKVSRTDASEQLRKAEEIVTFIRKETLK